MSGTTSSQNDAFARTPTICDTLGTLAISSGGVNDHDSKIISPAAPNIQNLNKKAICENHLFIQVSKPGSIMVILEHIFCVNPNTVRNQKWLKCNKYWGSVQSPFCVLGCFRRQAHGDKSHRWKAKGRFRTGVPWHLGVIWAGCGALLGRLGAFGVPLGPLQAPALNILVAIL